MEETGRCYYCGSENVVVYSDGSSFMKYSTSTGCIGLSNVNGSNDRFLLF